MGDTDSLREMAKEFEREYDMYERILKTNGVNESPHEFSDYDGSYYFQKKMYRCVYVQLKDGRNKCYLVRDDDTIFNPTGMVEVKNNNCVNKTLQFKDGFLHANVTPAYVEHYVTGTPVGKTMKYNPQKIQYYLEGIQYTFEQFWEKQKDTEYGPVIFARVYADKNKT